MGVRVNTGVTVDEQMLFAAVLVLAHIIVKDLIIAWSSGVYVSSRSTGADWLLFLKLHLSLKPLIHVVAMSTMTALDTLICKSSDTQVADLASKKFNLALTIITSL